MQKCERGAGWHRNSGVLGVAPHTQRPLVCLSVFASDTQLTHSHPQSSLSVSLSPWRAVIHINCLSWGLGERRGEERKGEPERWREGEQERRRLGEGESKRGGEEERRGE